MTALELAACYRLLKKTGWFAETVPAAVISVFVRVLLVVKVRL